MTTIIAIHLVASVAVGLVVASLCIHVGRRIGVA